MTFFLLAFLAIVLLLLIEVPVGFAFGAGALVYGLMVGLIIYRSLPLSIYVGPTTKLLLLGHLPMVLVLTFVPPVALYLSGLLDRVSLAVTLKPKFKKDPRTCCKKHRNGQQFFRSECVNRAFGKPCLPMKAQWLTSLGSGAISE
jgi:hypothetical protein